MKEIIFILLGSFVTPCGLLIIAVNTSKISLSFKNYADQIFIGVILTLLATIHCIVFGYLIVKYFLISNKP